MDQTCWACRDDQANQTAHMDYGGCLYQEESLSDSEEILKISNEIPSNVSSENHLVQCICTECQGHRQFRTWMNYVAEYHH